MQELTMTEMGGVSGGGNGNGNNGNGNGNGGPNGGVNIGGMEESDRIMDKVIEWIYSLR